jgi:branched-chain amino acid aminotransferase
MNFRYFSDNGIIKPVEQAVIPLNNIEYSYGFGVYESIRVSNGYAYFIEEHCERLMNSAAVIDLEHNFRPEIVQQLVEDLIAKNEVGNCNIKLLLIGGKTKDSARLYIMCLNPLYPDRQMYKQGVHCIVYNHERNFPSAKTLNMLPSYLAYRQAKVNSAYDALFVNRAGCITEGTRSNFFVAKGRTIFTPPAGEVLQGVTRANVIRVAQEEGFEIIETEISLDDLNHYKNAFITNTSVKILPIKTIEDVQLSPPSQELKKLMSAFDEYLLARRTNDAGKAA